MGFEGVFVVYSNVVVGGCEGFVWELGFVIVWLFIWDVVGLYCVFLVWFYNMDVMEVWLLFVGC